MGNQCSKTNLPFQNQVEKTLKDGFQERKIKLTLNQVKNHAARGIIGYDQTFLALKNSTSYLVATNGEGLKVIENSIEIYSSELPVPNGSVKDTIYIQHLNCYLLCHEEKIYKKDVNDRHPKLLIDISSGSRPGACFRYSHFNKRLIINKDKNTISVVNVERRLIEIEAKKQVGDHIVDFKVFGEIDEQVISLTSNGNLLSYFLNYAMRKVCAITRVRIPMVKRRDERALSLTVCPNNKFAFIELIYGRSHKCSRIAIFEVSGNTFAKKSVIDQTSTRLGCKYVVECCGYFENYVLWIGLSYERVAQLYNFSPETGALRELETVRIAHGEREPYQIHRLHDKYFYVGYLGNVKYLNLSFTTSSISD